MADVTTVPDKPHVRGRAKLSPAMLLVIAVIIMAGVLFGYDQGVISGALAGIQKQFGLGSLLTEVVTSWVTLGALFGSLIGGELADRLGRKKAVLCAGVLFSLGAIVQSIAPDTTILVAGRLVIGLGVGVAAVAAPLYGAEMAPAAWRGRFVSAYQLAITIGIFLAYLIDQLLAATDHWRLMLGIAAIPGLLLVIAMALAPESARWLAKNGRGDAARRVLDRLDPDADNAPALAAIESGLRSEVKSASWRDIFAPAWRKPLFVALGLAVFQQITGINAIIYYADEIFARAGFATPEAQTMATTWAIGAVNVLATFIAIALIDKLGRRPLLLTGLVGMGVSLGMVGIAMHADMPGMVTLVALVVFIISFAFSLGPVVWTVINEIFPGAIRGRAVAVATAVNWASAFLVSQFFLSLVGLIGEAITFWLFSFFCAVAFVWIYARVPETKGRSLEDIEQLWR
ncbi:MAG: sugar porter family MFS transporter [Rhizobiales bacterium]|nr:sugar porter family MFS transporter [Hyphomicrobiales bacterium]